jgi:broad specificity phosphatase PhoE
MGKRFYFVRHGTTEGNEKDQFQLPTISLSEAGRSQADFVAKRFKTIPIQTVISSTMTRALETAHAIARETGVPLVENELFEEIKRPSLVRGRSKQDPEVHSIMKLVKENFGNPNWRHSDEENFFLLRDRAKQCLDLLLALPEDNVAIVTHGNILIMMLAILAFKDGVKPEDFHGLLSVLATSNTGITTIKYDELGWYILTWNDHAHLGEVK